MRIDDEAVCSACRTAESRLHIDYSTRIEELQALLKSSASGSGYHCVVAWSGGKDSSSIALKLRNEFDLNPLLITFNPLIPTIEGQENRQILLDQGFDSIMVQANPDISRHLSRRFFIERGDPKIHWNAGVNAAPVRYAAALGIPYVFYAEHGESEYGGRVLSERHLRERDIEEVLEHQIGDDPINWITDRISESDLFPYLYPDVNQVEAIGLRALYFAYFTPWDVTENYKYVSEMLPFRLNSRGRTYGTFTDYDSVDDTMDDLYYYMQYIKFGFGRCLRDAARMVQRGKLTRLEAYDLICAYDGEFPEDSIDICLDYLHLSREEFLEIVDRHRDERIWIKNGDNWLLRTPITAD